MKKKMLAILLSTAVLSGALTGCSRSSKAPESAAQPTAAPSADAAASEETGASGTDSQGVLPAEGTDGPETVTVILDYVANTNHTGMFVALYQGYYAEEGLEVNIIEPTEGATATLVAVGKGDFGISYQEDVTIARTSADPLPIKAIAAIIQHNTSGIMSRQEDGITRAKEMEGHVYTTWEMAVEQATIKQIMESDGGDFSKLKMVPYTVDDEIAGLKANMFDCVWVYEGWACQNAKVQDYPVNYFSFKDMDDVFDFYTPVIAANIEYAQANPEVAKAFLRAVKKGYEFAVQKPEDAAKILLEEVPELDADLVNASASFLAGEYTAEAESWGVIDKDRWAKYFQWLNDNDLVTNKLDVNAGFDTSYLA